MKISNILCIVGPTASGKSELAVKLAKKYNGEIISVDSRQIYKGFDIGAGKVEGHWTNSTITCHPGRHNENGGNTATPFSCHSGRHKSRSDAGDPGSIKKIFVYKNIPHYLIDEASPRIQYSVSRFKKNASKKIQQILKKGKLPILCGGTMHWMDAVVFDQNLPNVKPNPKLRKQLETLSTEQLYSKLKKLDPIRAKHIDSKNPRRLIRALEIILTTGKPVSVSPTSPPFQDGAHESLEQSLTSPPFQGGVATKSTGWSSIWIGLNPGMEVLEKKIKKRLNQRLKQGMIKEVAKIHEQGLSWKRLESFGLEYKYCALFLQNKITQQELEEQLYTAIRQYAKRQLTWWKRNKQIHWISNDSQIIPLKNL